MNCFVLCNKVNKALHCKTWIHKPSLGPKSGFSITHFDFRFSTALLNIFYIYLKLKPDDSNLLGFVALFLALEADPHALVCFMHSIVS